MKPCPEAPKYSVADSKALQTVKEPGGISSGETALTADPKVSFYIDGVYIGKQIGSALDVAAIERVEVLRGPQGTLYGRNATGGTVNMITNRAAPNALAGNIEGQYGNYDHKKITGSVNIPLGDQFAARFADYHGAKYGVCCANGSVTLELALRAALYLPWLVGQIAKIKGCRAVGIAGGPEKGGRGSLGGGPGSGGAFYRQRAGRF